MLVTEHGRKGSQNAECHWGARTFRLKKSFELLVTETLNDEQAGELEGFEVHQEYSLVRAIA